MTPEELYLDLLKKCLTRSAFGEEYKALCPAKGSIKQLLFEPARRLLANRRLELVRKEKFDPQARFEAVDWPLEAETMIGLRRMQNLQECTIDVLQRGVPGDLVETGVSRGGATIFMRGVLKAYGERENGLSGLQTHSRDCLCQPLNCIPPTQMTSSIWQAEYWQFRWKRSSQILLAMVCLMTKCAS